MQIDYITPNGYTEKPVSTLVVSDDVLKIIHAGGHIDVRNTGATPGSHVGDLTCKIFSGDGPVSSRTRPAGGLLHRLLSGCWYWSMGCFFFGFYPRLLPGTLKRLPVVSTGSISRSHQHPDYSAVTILSRVPFNRKDRIPVSPASHHIR
jgi:hypothetical protein